MSNKSVGRLDKFQASVSRYEDLQQQLKTVSRRISAQLAERDMHAQEKLKKLEKTILTTAAPVMVQPLVWFGS